MSYTFAGRDKYGDHYDVQAYEPSGSSKGRVFLELFDDTNDLSIIHMYTPRRARRLATSLLVAANIAEQAIEEL